MVGLTSTFDPPYIVVRHLNWGGLLDDRFVSPLPVKGSRIRQNAGRRTRILANAATSQWRRTYEMVI